MQQHERTDARSPFPAARAALRRRRGNRDVGSAGGRENVGVYRGPALCGVRMEGGPGRGRPGPRPNAQQQAGANLPTVKRSEAGPRPGSTRRAGRRERRWTGPRWDRFGFGGGSAFFVIAGTPGHAKPNQAPSPRKVCDPTVFPPPSQLLTGEGTSVASGDLANKANAAGPRDRHRAGRSGHSGHCRPCGSHGAEHIAPNTKSDCDQRAP